MLPSLFWTLLLGIWVYAFARGAIEHRIAAAGCVVATLATSLLRSPHETKYEHVELGVLAVDVLLFALFLAIALRSQRFWPLWVAGFHLVTVTAHAIRALKFDLIPAAYAVAVQFWSYPVLLCIGIAVWRYRRRLLLGLEPANPPPASI